MKSNREEQKTKYKGSTEKPLVTVVMASFNTAQYISEAITSISQQTLRDIELIIVDDGSTDDTDAIVDRHRKADSRIRYIKLGHNSGGASTPRNIGFQKARGNYIALMDSDDVSKNDRLEIQSRLLDSNPNVDICGTYLEDYHSQEILNSGVPRINEEIRCLSFFNTPLAHATIMFKRNVILKSVGGYDIQYRRAEDFDFLSRLGRDHEIQFHEIQKSLYRYRLQFDDRLKNAEDKVVTHPYVDKIRLSNIRWLLGRELSDDEEKNYLAFCSGRISKDSSIIRCLKWQRALRRGNMAARVFDELFFYRYLKDRSKNVAREFFKSKLPFRNTLRSLYKSIRT